MPPNNQYTDQSLVVPPANPATQPLLPQKSKKPWLLIGIIVIISLLLISSLGFGYWAYTERQDYKNNSDQKATLAVKNANEEQKKTLEAQFEEREKSPYKSYTTPVQYGSVKIVYSKIWSAYVVEQISGGGTVVNGYFYPDFVPNVGANDKTNYSLRFQLIDSPYNTEVSKYTNFVKQGKIKSTAFVPEQVKGASVGVKLDGQLEPKKRGLMVILPIRDKTIKIWTENESAKNDFNAVVLKNLTYTP